MWSMMALLVTGKREMIRIPNSNYITGSPIWMINWLFRRTKDASPSVITIQNIQLRSVQLITCFWLWLLGHRSDLLTGLMIEQLSGRVDCCFTYDNGVTVTSSIFIRLDGIQFESTICKNSIVRRVRVAVLNVKMKPVDSQIDVWPLIINIFKLNVSSDCQRSSNTTGLSSVIYL